MNYPTASGGVSNTQTEKPFVASHGELDPKKLRLEPGENGRLGHRLLSGRYRPFAAGDDRPLSCSPIKSLNCRLTTNTHSIGIGVAAQSRINRGLSPIVRPAALEQPPGNVWVDQAPRINWCTTDPSRGCCSGISPIRNREPCGPSYENMSVFFTHRTPLKPNYIVTYCFIYDDKCWHRICFIESV